MLPLIFFSLLVGIAATHVKSQPFTAFLNAGAMIFMKVISYIMLLAPIGFFAFFAVLVSELGPQIIQQYLRVTWIYYSAAVLYFILFYTLFVYLANGVKGIKSFWGNVFVPMITSLATCSSAASIPANLAATEKMGVPISICETVIPVGAIVHKDGSVLGAIVKIAFLFGIYGMAFSSLGAIMTAIFIAILVGTVMGAIPSGGMLGEMLILSFYGFPPESLLIIAAISIIIDPIATMLNVTGDSVAAILVARFTR
jgi:Na+/H+-dicarboxylate symporter